MASKDVVVNIVSDASDMLKGYKKAIAEIEKYGNKAQMFNGIKSDMDSLSKDFKTLSDTVKNLGAEKIDTSQIDNLIKKIEKQDEKIKALQKNNKKLKLEVDSSSTDKLNSAIEKASELLSGLEDRMKVVNATKVGLNLENIIKSSKDIEALENELKNLNNVKNELARDNTDISPVKSTESSIKALVELQNKYKETRNYVADLQKQLKAANGTPQFAQMSKDYESAMFKMGQYAKKVLDVQNSFEMKPNNINFINEDELTKNLNIAEKKVKLKVSEIENSISELKNLNQSEIANLQLKNGKVTVGLEVGTTIATLRKQAEDMIKAVQAQVWNNPLMVPLKFTSSYVTKAKDELANLRNLINTSVKSENKDQMISQIENLDKQLRSRDFKVEFTTNIQRIEKNVKEGLTEIQAALKNAKLYVYPTMTISEDDVVKLQKTIDSITKKLSINPKVEVLEKDLKVLKTQIDKIAKDIKLTPKFDKINKNDFKILQDQVDQISKDLLIKPKFEITESELTTLKEQLKKVSGALNIDMSSEMTKLSDSMAKLTSTQLIDKWGSKFLSTIDQICNKINSSFDLMSKNSLYNTMKGWSDADTIMRNNRVGRGSTENEKSAYGELERMALINTNTGKVGNTYTSDQIGSVNNNIIDDLINLEGGLKSVVGEFNAYIHTHPIKNTITFPSGKQYNGTGSDLLFSEGDLGSYGQRLKQGIKKLMVESNGMINELDLSSISKTALNKIISEYQNGLDDVIFSKSSYAKYMSRSKTGGNGTYDYTKRAQLSNDYLSSLITKHTGEQDASKFLKQYNIEDLKLDPNKIQQDQKEINALTQILMEMSNALTSINNKNIKLDTKGLDNVSKQLKMIVDIIIELNEQIRQIDFSKINISSEPINQINKAIENMSSMMQRAFGVLSDNELSAKFDSLKEKFNAIAKDDGSFDARKKDVKQLIASYEEYVKLGGKASIAGLTTNDKSQDKLLDLYDKYIEKQKKISEETAKSAQKSSAATEKEKESFSKVETKANDAAKAKEEFVKANKNVKASAEESTTQVNNESDALDKVNNSKTKTTKAVTNGNTTNTSTNTTDTESQSSTQTTESILDNEKKKQQASNETTEIVLANEEKKQEIVKVTMDSLVSMNSGNKQQWEKVGGLDAFRQAFERFYDEENMDLKTFLENYAATLNNAPGLKNSHNVINTDENGNLKSANISYYNEQLHQTVTETWAWHEANAEVIGDVSKLILTNVKSDDNVRARELEKEKAEQDALNESIKEYQAKLKEIEKLNTKNANTKEKNANFLLEEQLKTIQKLAKIKAEIITRDSNGKDTSAIQGKLGYQKLYLKRLREELNLYEDTEAYKNQRAAVSDANLNAKMTVADARNLANQKEENRILRENEKLENEIAKIRTKVSAFDSKTQNKMQDNQNYIALSKLLNNGFKNLGDVEKAKQLLESLDSDLNKINTDARRGSTSFDIFSNMIEGIEKADQKINELKISFKKLNNPSEDVNTKFTAALSSLVTLKGANTVEEQAKAYGDYRVAMNEATAAVRNANNEESLLNTQFIKIRNLVNQMSSKQAKLSILDPKTDSAQITQLMTEIDVLDLKLTKAKEKFEKMGGTLNLEQVQELDSLWLKVNTATEKALNKDKFEQAKKDYQELKKVLLEISKLNGQKTNAIMNGNTFSIDSITEQLDKLEERKLELGSRLSNNLKGQNVLDENDFNMLKELSVKSNNRLDTGKFKQAKEIQDFADKLLKAGMLTDELHQKLSILSSDIVDVDNNQGLQRVNNEFKNIKDSIPSDKVKEFSSIFSSVLSLPSNEGKINAYSEGIETIQSKVVALRNAIIQTDTTDDAFFTDGELDAKKYAQQIEDLKQSIRNIKSDKYNMLNEKGSNIGQVDVNSQGNIKGVKDAATRMREYANAMNYGKETGIQLNETAGKVNMTFKAQDGTITKLTGDIISEADALRMNAIQTKGNIGLFGSFSGVLKSVGGYFKMYFTGYMMVTRVFSKFREGLTVLKEYDTALTTISYTMDLTKEGLQNLGASAVQMAKDLSMSLDDAMSIYQIYANMNTTANEIAETAKPTAILSNLSGVDASTASDQVQGILQQFGLLEDGERNVADTSMHVVDALDKISASVSIDYAKGIQIISDAVQASGQAAHDAGLSYEQLAAISAKVAERTREDGGSIGNSIKTIVTRISKVGKMPAYADDVSNEELSNASKSLHEIGVEVYNADGSFRELDTILEELSGKWDSLTDAQQANNIFLYVQKCA